MGWRWSGRVTIVVTAPPSRRRRAGSAKALLCGFARLGRLHADNRRCRGKAGAAASRCPCARGPRPSRRCETGSILSQRERSVPRLWGVDQSRCAFAKARWSWSPSGARVAAISAGAAVAQGSARPFARVLGCGKKTTTARMDAARQPLARLVRAGLRGRAVWVRCLKDSRCPGRPSIKKRVDWAGISAEWCTGSFQALFPQQILGRRKAWWGRQGIPKVAAAFRVDPEAPSAHEGRRPILPRRAGPNTAKTKPGARRPWSVPPKARR